MLPRPFGEGHLVGGVKAGLRGAAVEGPRDRKLHGCCAEGPGTASHRGWIMKEGEGGGREGRGERGESREGGVGGRERGEERGRDGGKRGAET